jgi:hypothetical protein
MKIKDAIGKITELIIISLFNAMLALLTGLLLSFIFGIASLGTTYIPFAYIALFSLTVFILSLLKQENLVLTIFEKLWANLYRFFKDA